MGKENFDLVLLDVEMPEMNGLEVLKRIRQRYSASELPVVMVTGKSRSEEIVDALELGANDYVTKPLDFPVVLARIRTQLALRQAVSQVTEMEQKLNARNKETGEGDGQEETLHCRVSASFSSRSWARW